MEDENGASNKKPYKVSIQNKSVTNKSVRISVNLINFGLVQYSIYESLLLFCCVWV